MVLLQIKSFLTIKADFIIRVSVSTSERPYMKTVRDEVTTLSGIGKKWYHQYTMSSATERADIGKYSAEMLWLPYCIATIEKHLRGEFFTVINNIHYVARENFCSLPTT